MSDATGYVYFIAAPSVDLIKIGFTENHPNGRLNTLQCASPIPLEAVALVYGEREDEAKLHAAFADARSHGEWFHVTPKLLAFIRTETVEWDVFLFQMGPRHYKVPQQVEVKWRRKRRDRLATGGLQELRRKMKKPSAAPKPCSFRLALDSLKSTS